MIDSDENEVLNLPKTVINQPTSTNGALKRYQDKLIEQYYTVFCSFQKLIKEVSDECEQQLKQRMVQFQEESNQIKKKQDDMLSTLGKNSFTFDELRDQLKSLGQDLTSRSLQLREDSLAIYSGSFLKLNPIVDRAFESCEIFLTQLPQKYAEKLPLEIKRLNESFLQTKQKLIQALYSIEISCRKQALKMDSEFVQRADEWKHNRFITIVEDAKKQFDLSNKIDFSSIFVNFRQDQKKFTFCFRKLVSNLALFSPPEHFTESDLESWWNEVVEMMDSHKNFISQFIGQFQTQVDQRNQENTQLISTLEKELFELASESEANQAMCDILPIYKQTQKYYISLLDKLTKYWNMRTEALFKSFESIHDFLKPLIENFQKFISEADENNQFVISETDEIKNQSQTEINQLESDLQMKSNEILVLTTQDDINNCVNECKEILTNIEKHYNDSYSKIISTYDTQPSLLTSLFEKIEKEILNIIKMRKISPSNDDDSSPHGAPGQPDQKRKGSSSGPRQSRKLMKQRTDNRPTNMPFFSFQVPNGAKYEEVTSLDLVPQFDDFIDEQTNVELTPQKGKGGKGGLPAQSGSAANERKATPNKGKRDRNADKKPGKTNAAAKKGGKNGGYSIDDFEDVECPEFQLSEVVPKAEDGTVSIWVYIPMNEELSEWSNNFRKSLMVSMNGEFEVKMKRAQYSGERARMGDELHEKMRLHAPRASSIEMNVAQKRMNQVETRQSQLEKHFLRSVSNFNSGVESILSSLERRKRLMANECTKLRSFIDNLSMMKNATNFTVLVQNLKASDRQWEAYFDKQKGDQRKEMDNFVSNFNQANQRFMDSVVMVDGTFSDEEKEHCKEYFANMSTHVGNILKELEAKVAEEIAEVEKLHNETIEEFEAKMIVHRADVTFIEALKQAQMDSKNKFEALLAKNKMMESEVDRLAGLVKVDDSLEFQPRLTDLFQKLDALRISINKRGAFLSLLRSQQNQAPIQFSLDLLLQQQQQQLMQRGSEEVLSSSNKKSRNDSKKGARGASNDDDKKHSKSKGKSKSKSSTDKSVSNEKTGPNESANDPSSSSTSNAAGSSNEAPKSLSFKLQFDKIESDFKATVMKLSTDFYNNLKTRKMPITRPELIPEQQQDCVDKCNDNWKSVTQNLPSVLSKSSIVFQTQVQNAETVSRDMMKKMFAFFASFYVEQLTKDKSDAQVQFDQSMKELAKERERHKAVMNAGMADKNKLDECKKLIEEENDRVLREMDEITNFNIQNIECEYRNMSLFTMNLPIFTNKLLNLFDRFIQIDDLSANSNISKGIERKTMRELMKDKARKSLPSASNDPNGRPFHVRDWPSLPAVMEPIILTNQRALQSAAQSVSFLKSIGVHFTPTSVLNNFSNGTQTIFGCQIDSQISIRSNNNNTTSNTNLISNAANSKKKKVTVKGSVNSSLNSNSNIGGNLKLQPLDEGSQKAMLSVSRSLDTSLNRGVIAERNKCYEDYEKMLAKRVEDFEKFTQSLKDETESFIKYWQICVSDLAPSLAVQNQESDD